MKPVTVQHPGHFALTKSSSSVAFICGICASFLYVIMNIVCALKYESYSSFSQTISELSAIGAPTRSLWGPLAIVYSILIIYFAWGVWRFGYENKNLRIAGMILFFNGVIGFFWPSMHQRDILAAGGGTLADAMHIAFAAVTVVLMALTMLFAGVALGRMFAAYSFLSLLAMFFFGILTSVQTSRMEANLPTPWMGVWERICIGVYLLWIIVLAVVLLNKNRVNR